MKTSKLKTNSCLLAVAPDLSEVLAPPQPVKTESPSVAAKATAHNCFALLVFIDMSPLIN